MKDLIEAIVLPSKAVSDQYQAHVIQTVKGAVYTGRIISENENDVTVVTDPEDATKFAVIEKDDIEEMFAANQSLMPAGLLDQLNEEEVLDLLAYTLSRGKANSLCSGKSRTSDLTKKTGVRKTLVFLSWQHH